jgi:hypothetical protein
MHNSRYAYFKVEKNALNNAPSPQLPQLTPAQLLVFFLRLLPCAEFFALPAFEGKRFYHRLFCPLVTLWYLLFQRINADHTLQAVVSDAANGGADGLNSKLSARMSSLSTSSFSDARQRLPWPVLAQALALQGRKMAQLHSQTLWRGLVLALLDGSTVRMRPQGDIPEDFPPQCNQHPNRDYWCLMRMVVCFCALSGAAVDCAMGSMHMSEQVQACQISLRCSLASLFIGDRNFGVFRVFQAVRQAGQQALIRMTDARALRLLGHALEPGDYALEWKPTKHDKLDPDSSNAPLKGRLLVMRLERRGFATQLLCLFTTLCDRAEYPAAELVRLYGLRWHIELNLRYLKTQMDMEQLEVQSADMVRKEWLAGLMAYNLIRAAMLCAALSQGISALSLSFSAARRCLECWLQQLGRCWLNPLESWERTLKVIGRCKLPCRKKPRPNEPRKQRHLRSSYPPLFGSRKQARLKLNETISKS